jgi:hypothetical protein
MNSSARDAGEMPTIRFIIDKGLIARRFCFVVSLLVIAGTFANWVIYHWAQTPEAPVARLFRRLDLGHEPSLPNFYSSLALLLCAVLLFVVFRLSRTRRARDAFYWLALAAIFLCMSIDEAILIHEMFNSVLQHLVDASGVLFLPWIIVGAAGAIVTGLLFLPFLLRLPRITAAIFIISGILFVSGAVGMEMVAALIFDSAGSEEAGVRELSHTFAQAFEEALEMLSIVLFMYGILDYISNESDGIKIEFID